MSNIYIKDCIYSENFKLLKPLPLDQYWKRWFHRCRKKSYKNYNATIYERQWQQQTTSTILIHELSRTIRQDRRTISNLQNFRDKHIQMTTIKRKRKWTILHHLTRKINILSHQDALIQSCKECLTPDIH